MICIADKSTKLRSGCSYGRLKRQAERRHFFSAELWGCAYFRTKQFKASPLPNAAIPTTRDGALRKLVEIAEFAGHWRDRPDRNWRVLRRKCCRRSDRRRLGQCIPAGSNRSAVRHRHSAKAIAARSVDLGCPSPEHAR